MCKQILSGLLLVLVAIGTRAGANGDVTGYAYDVEQDKLRYLEAYDRVYDAQGRLQQATVTYLSPGERTLATKKLEYAHPYAPNVSFTNKAAGYAESVRWLADGRVEVGHSQDAGPWQKKVLEVKEPVVADAGFDTYLQDHIAALQQGERLTFQFLNPARLDWFRFQARKIAATQSTIKIEVAPASQLLRWLVEPILLTYQLPTTEQERPRLLHYNGLTNMSLDGENTLVANIYYEYEESETGHIVYLF